MALVWVRRSLDPEFLADIDFEFPEPIAEFRGHRSRALRQRYFQSLPCLLVGSLRRTIFSCSEVKITSNSVTLEASMTA